MLSSSILTTQFYILFPILSIPYRRFVMSEQQQVQPRRTEETIQQPVEISVQVVSIEEQEQIFDDEIDISDLVQDSMDIAKVFKQKGGQ